MFQRIIGKLLLCSKVFKDGNYSSCEQVVLRIIPILEVYGVISCAFVLLLAGDVVA